MTANMYSVSKSTIFYDGSCAFCNTWIKIIKRLDHQNRINISTLQSVDFSALPNKHKSNPPADTVILLHHEKIYIKSDAVLRVISILGFPFNLLSIFRIVPRRCRDKFYDFIARNRYRFAGQVNSCAIPPAVHDK